MSVPLVRPDEDAQEESDNNRDRPQDAVPTVLEADIDDADGDDRHTQERAHNPPFIGPLGQQDVSAIIGESCHPRNRPRAAIHLTAVVGCRIMRRAPAGLWCPPRHMG
jgi:hypothetical protein